MFRIASVLPLAFLLGCSGAPTESACTPRPSTATAPWRELTDAQLHEQVARACGRVLIGFKEAGASRGVNEQGQSITAPETVVRMKAYVQELGGEIEMEYQLVPAVAARVPARADVVAALRAHPNVDTVEPVFPGTRW